MSNPHHRCLLAIFADYHQFYVWDPDASRRQAPEQWTDQDVADRAKAVPGVVVICPVRNMEVSVEVGIWNSEPQVIFGAWQHVVEAPLARTGLIEIHECTGGSPTWFTVQPRAYPPPALYR